MEIDNPGHIKTWLQALSPSDFEVFISEVWEELGYTTFVTPQSNDKGIDVIASKEDPFRRKQLIQVKRYTNGNKIGSQTVREYRTLYDQESSVDSVVIITSNDFTPQAENLANDLGVNTLDGFELGVLIQEETPDLLNKWREENKGSLQTEKEASPTSDSPDDGSPKYEHLINRSGSSTDRTSSEVPDPSSSKPSDSGSPSTSEDDSGETPGNKKEYGVYEEEVREFYSELNDHQG